MTLLMSSFLGYYHRIYDVDNKKIYFSYVESSKNGDNGNNGNNTNNKIRNKKINKKMLTISTGIEKLVQ